MADTRPSRREVLFLPGLLCDEMLWRDQVMSLADVAQMSVADLTQDRDMATMAQRALAAAPGRFTLVALSMGGYVAFEIMRQAPERVISLVLLSTSAGPDDASRRAQRRAAIEALKLGRFLGVTDRMLPQLIHRSRLGDPVAERVKAMVARVGADAFLRQQEAILDRQDSLPLLPRIDVPVLVGVGDSDTLTPPAEATRIHEGIAGSTLHVFRACGHLPPMERPDETNALLRTWLTFGVGERGSGVQN